MELFLLLTASHLCGDLLSYSRFLARIKRTDKMFAKMGALMVHCLVHAVFVLIWLWFLSWRLKVSASIFVFVTHFLIDFGRVSVEPLLIDRGDFVILKRKDVIRHFLGNGDAKTARFMKRHFKKWALLNLGDQLMHVFAIGAFAMAVTV